MRERFLLLTVGTGDLDRLRESLFEPLKKSVRKGRWARVHLLPSAKTAPLAETLAAEIRTEWRKSGIHTEIEVDALPEPGDEDDADRCFEHFSDLLQALRDDGARPDDILVDFTRGTKAMSAALVAAAVRHELPALRYVRGGERDRRGMVVPGTEEVVEFHTRNALRRQNLDRLRGFLRSGNFAAVLESLREDADPLAGPLRSLAEFFAAWDALDYARAAKIRPPERFPGAPEFRAFAPEKAALDHLQALAEPPGKHDSAGRWIPYLRRLAADLLANAERRLRDRLRDDALVRSWRVLECIVLADVYEEGLDPYALRPDQNPDRMPHVHALVDALRGRIPEHRRCEIDTLRGALMKRHESPLTHGHAAAAPAESKLRRRLEKLELLLREADPSRAHAILAVARFHDRPNPDRRQA